MKNTSINLAMLAVGAAIGSAVTWKLVKTKYERIAQEEIDSVKEVYSRKEEHSEPVEIKTETPEPNKTVLVDKPYLKTYAAMIQKEGYMDYSRKSEPEPKQEKEKYTRDMDDFAYDEEPYVIAPEHFDEYDDYETQSLTYYADGYLADDNGDLIEDIDGTVGIDFDEHIGDFEDDSVHIRNERLKTDFEILASNSKYMDTVVSRPE